MVTESSRSSLWPTVALCVVVGAVAAVLGALVARAVGLGGWAAFGVAVLVAVVDGAVAGKLVVRLRRRRDR